MEERGIWFEIEMGKNLKLLQMEYKVRISNENGSTVTSFTKLTDGPGPQVFLYATL